MCFQKNKEEIIEKARALAKQSEGKEIILGRYLIHLKSQLSELKPKEEPKKAVEKKKEKLNLEKLLQSPSKTLKEQWELTTSDAEKENLKTKNITACKEDIEKMLKEGNIDINEANMKKALQALEKSKKKLIQQQNRKNYNAFSKAYKSIRKILSNEIKKNMKKFNAWKNTLKSKVENQQINAIDMLTFKNHIKSRHNKKIVIDQKDRHAKARHNIEQNK